MLAETASPSPTTTNDNKRGLPTGSPGSWAQSQWPSAWSLQALAVTGHEAAFFFPLITCDHVLIDTWLFDIKCFQITNGSLHFTLSLNVLPIRYNYTIIIVNSSLYIKLKIWINILTSSRFWSALQQLLNGGALSCIPGIYRKPEAKSKVLDWVIKSTLA